MSVTFNSLVEEIRNYVEREDPNTVDRIPFFINTAIQMVARESKTIGFQVYSGGTFQPGESTIPKPARWRTSVAFNFGTGEDFNSYNPILLRAYEYVRMYNPDATQTGAPKFYADQGPYNIVIAPTPDAPYPYIYVYQELPVPLSEDQQTNWLTNYAPDVLLFGSLRQAALYLKNNEDMTRFEKGYMESLNSLNGQNADRAFDRQSKREAG